MFWEKGNKNIKMAGPVSRIGRDKRERIEIGKVRQSSESIGKMRPKKKSFVKKNVKTFSKTQYT